VTPLLEVDGVQAGYGTLPVLFGVDLAIMPGEAVTLLGRNGMGKTTTVRCIVGLLKSTAGSIRLDGRRIDGWTADRIGRAGIALVPEGRRIFANLSVRENLIAFAADRSGANTPWTLERIFALFPRLAERAGNMGAELSGGEQQMLAIGRALMTNPKALDPRRGDGRPGAAVAPGDLARARRAQRQRPRHSRDRQVCRPAGYALPAPHHPGARAGRLGRSLRRARCGPPIVGALSRRLARQPIMLRRPAL
jgi:ABC-type uncharacterized transport system ATPase subunit